MQRVHNTLKLAIKLRDGLICFWCNEMCDLIGREREPTLDHLITLKSNGASTWENLVVACRDCNQRRRSKSVEEFASVRGISVEEVHREIRRRTGKSKKKYIKQAREHMAYERGRKDAIDESIRAQYMDDGGF